MKQLVHAEAIPSPAFHEPPTSSLRPFISLEAVTKRYPGANDGDIALRAVNLQMEQGGLIAIVGKSGSGKSTLLHLLTAVDRPTTGSIHVNGSPVHELDETAGALWRRASVGIVFQFFQLLPTLTALENVLLPMALQGHIPANAREARARELLARVGIADQAHKLPATLSGGQQQRCAIARALANDPPLLVADEPTGNLDSLTAEAVLLLLRQQADAGKTVVVVTHELDIARVADRVVTLADGRVVADKVRTSTPNAGVTAR